MKLLRRAQFGNPILREKAEAIALGKISSAEIQELIASMRHTLIKKKLGIGLAAPQVGRRVALAVIAIRPTALRPKIEPFDLVIINPEITERIGRKKALWEGCISSGAGGKAGLFAQVPRYRQVKVKYYDETGKLRHKTFKDLPARVIQHEVDHLNGILFVDKVKDPKTYMTYAEYKKRISNKMV